MRAFREVFLIAIGIYINAKYLLYCRQDSHLIRRRWATNHRSRLGLIPLDVLCAHPDGILVYHEKSNDIVSDNPFDAALSNPHMLPLPQRCPGPDNPQWKIPPSEWPTVLRRIDQGEPLRQVARDYGVSYEAVRRVVQAALKRGLDT